MAKVRVQLYPRFIRLMITILVVAGTAVFSDTARAESDKPVSQNTSKYVAGFKQKLERYILHLRTKHLWTDYSAEKIEALERKEYELRRELGEILFSKTNDKKDFPDYELALKALDERAQQAIQEFEKNKNSESAKADLITIWDLANKLMDEWAYRFGDTILRKQHTDSALSQVGNNVGNISAALNAAQNRKVIGGAIEYAKPVANKVSKQVTTRLKTAAKVNPAFVPKYFSFLRAVNQIPGVAFAAGGSALGIGAGKLAGWYISKPIPPSPADIIYFGVRDTEINENDITIYRQATSSILAWLASDLTFLSLRALRFVKLIRDFETVAAPVSGANIIFGIATIYVTIKVEQAIDGKLKQHRFETLRNRVVRSAKDFKEAMAKNDEIGLMIATDKLILNSTKLSGFLNLDVENISLVSELTRKECLAFDDAIHSLGFSYSNPYNNPEFLHELALRYLADLDEDSLVKALERTDRAINYKLPYYLQATTLNQTMDLTASPYLLGFNYRSLFQNRSNSVFYHLYLFKRYLEEGESFLDTSDLTTHTAQREAYLQLDQTAFGNKKKGQQLIALRKRYHEMPERLWYLNKPRQTEQNWRELGLSAGQIKEKFDEFLNAISDPSKPWYQRMVLEIEQGWVPMNPNYVLMQAYTLLRSSNKAYIEDKAEILFDKLKDNYWVYVVAKAGRHFEPEMAAEFANRMVLRTQEVF